MLVDDMRDKDSFPNEFTVTISTKCGSMKSGSKDQNVKDIGKKWLHTCKLQRLYCEDVVTIKLYYKWSYNMTTTTNFILNKTNHLQHPAKMNFIKTFSQMQIVYETGLHFMHKSFLSMLLQNSQQNFHLLALPSITYNFNLFRYKIMLIATHIYINAI